MTEIAPKKPLMSNELRLRILSALVLGPIVIGVVWIGGWLFSALLVVAGFWYLVMTTVLSWPQSYLEKKYGRGFYATTTQRRWLGRIGKASA